MEQKEHKQLAIEALIRIDNEIRELEDRIDKLQRASRELINKHDLSSDPLISKMRF